MFTKNVFRLGFVLILTADFIGCNSGGNDNTTRFSKTALQGKQVFESKKCGTCHSIGEARGDSTAPNLADPFIANDSMFVRAHLEFVEKTKMPPIELSDREMRLVSDYVAELHRANHPSVPEKEADTYCPVCYAPVASKQAVAENLFVSYLGDKYYFECQDCVKTFEKAPEAFLVLWRDYLKKHNKHIRSSLK
ncbi:MAG: c-type cytochrome [bacterium]